jgi:dihydroorotase-like cyclic amidohydrolase
MYNLVIKNGNIVFPGKGVHKADIGINRGIIVCVGEDLGSHGEKVIDANEKFVFPGIVDSHFHMGIFRPLSEDARSESASAVAGGVTTILIYYRAGRNNLISESDPVIPELYSTLYPRVLELSFGSFFSDYGYHIAPVTAAHLEEIPELVQKHGVTTFKYYMHYKGLTPDEFATRKVEKEFLFSDTPYDLGYLNQIMQKVASVNNEVAGVRVNIHAENPAIIRVNTEATMRELSHLQLNPLEAYSRTRPPSGERLGILEAAEMANQAGCPISILHVSSSLALSTIKQVRAIYPDLNIMAEATVHHLILTTDCNPSAQSKVNPPIRSEDDKEALWRGVIDGTFDTIVSDHAASHSEFKGDNIWKAWYGFGGTELLLPSVITEGFIKRRLPLERIADLLSLSPARFHGLSQKKGDIALGYDADFAICDLSKTKVVDHTKLHSAQDFSPFDGLKLTGWIETTILRGEVVYQNGQVMGEPRGEYIKRPASLAHG